MFLKTSVLAVVIGLGAVLPAAAQPRQRGGGSVPPGHMPPPGLCRVWYDGVQPGRQPRPVNCRTAESIASRTRGARVIYGDDGWWSSRSRRGPYGDNRGGYGYRYQTPAVANGYSDGFDKGREDVRDRDRFNPERHGRYRSADRGYRREFGGKDDFRRLYRQGFLQGYRDGYQGTRRDRGWGR
jgi:hypothetical protein